MSFPIKVLTGALLCAFVRLYGQNVQTICASSCNYAPDQLQRAVDEATPGTIIEIDGTATTNTGLVLRKKDNPQGLYITLRSARLSNLPADTRVSPDDENLATITYTARRYLVMTAEQAAGYYRFEGIRFIPMRNDSVRNLIQFGTFVDGRTFDKEVWQLPHDLEFDRCVFSGYAGEDGPYRGILANTGRLAVTNSVIREIKGPNQESQGIAGWNSKGPYYFRNNRFETSAIQTLFGGAAPNQRGLRADGLYFGGNHYYKPWRWRVRNDVKDPQPPCRSDANGGEYFINSNAGTIWNCQNGSWITVTEADIASQVVMGSRTGNGNPSFNCPGNNTTYKDVTPDVANPYWICTTSGGWVNTSFGTWAARTYMPNWQKNQFELKNANGALVEGNILENGWLPGNQSQRGAAFLFNQVDNDDYMASTGGGDPAAMVSNVVVRHNLVKNVPWGVGNSGIGKYYQPIRDISLQNNLFAPFGEEPESLNDVRFMQLGAQGRYTVLYNTVVATRASGGGAIEMYTKVPSQQIVIAGNILAYLQSGFRNDTGSGNLRTAVDASLNPNRSISKNVIVDQQGTNAVRENLLTPNTYSTGLTPCASCAVPRYYENGGNNDVGFVDFSNGDYHLSPTSPYGGDWAHGKPAGADVDSVLAATEFTVAGQYNPFLDFKVRRLLTGATGAQVGYTAYNDAACTMTVSDRPDLGNPAFVKSDDGGDKDRAMEIAGLEPAHRYFYELRCGRYQRNGQFMTTRPIPE